jgi:hypothetical protein
MTRTDLCAGGDGRITFVKQGRWDDEVWVHKDGTRYRDGHVAQPAPQCSACGSPKVTFKAADPWAETCQECGWTNYPMSKETA